MTRIELINTVKARLDELLPFDKKSVVYSQNDLLQPIDAIIDSQLDSATTELLLRAPLHLLKSKSHTLDSLTISPDNIGYINMPSDFLRIALVWLREWERPATVAISKQHPKYAHQRNTYTRGRSSKPVVVLADSNPYLTARWLNYSCQLEILDTSAWANNSYEIAKTLQLSNRSISLLSAFENHGSLTELEYQRLSEDLRTARRDSLLAILNDEYGQDLSLLVSNTDRRINTSSCPIDANLATITLVNDNPTWGTLSGGGMHNIGTIIAVVAEPSDGYEFKGWYEGSILVSDSLSYSFIVTGNRTLNGTFEATPIPKYTVVVESEDESKGTAVGGGTVEEGNSVSVSATPKEGYEFSGWYLNSETLIEGLKEQDEFYPEKDCTLIATFIRKYKVELISEDESMGTVSEGGDVYAGDSIHIKATPKEGFELDGWYLNSETLIEGLAEEDDYFPEDDCVLQARFKESEKVLISAEPADASMGSTTGSGEYVINTPVTIIAFPRLGYRFDGWYDENNQLISTSLSYTFPAEEDKTFIAKFSIVPYIVTLKVDSDNGTVSGGGEVIPGDSVTCIADPKGGSFYGWTNESNIVVSTSTTYTFTPIGSITLTAHFLNLP